ncbi:MAG TPA: peptidoglycan DD-metalloendopeptidase family protein [Edaphocola sp.]|nr:peptidoglycan DD-metalloendopeptidase family protein [Edaphocola sp.]
MRIFVFLFLFLFAAQAVQAQKPSRQELEKRRSALLREISETQEQLAATTKDRRASVSQLKAINSKLRARQNLISTINSELGNINSDIGQLKGDIQVMNNNLKTLKSRYAQSVRYAYKHRTSQSLILFLFSSNNFNDAVRRMQYLKKYRDYRKTQADNIRKAQAKLSQKINALNNRKQDKASLLQTEETQQAKIQQEQAETDKMVQELKGREGELMAQIRKNQHTANQIQAAIKAEIQREIALARKKAEEEARRKAAEEAKRKAAEALARKKAEEAARQQTTANSGNVYKAGNQSVALNTGGRTDNSSAPNTSSSSNTKPGNTSSEDKPESNSSITTATAPSYKLSLTPEAQALSNSFAANRGKLPWPVSNGFISSPYGRHSHPVYKSVTIENNGIDIATYPHAPVRAVFSGTVIKVVNINGYVVMISHGEYFTVYSNLSSVSVSAGQNVTTKQTIGAAGVNSDGDNMINFQIWKVGSNNASSTVNPSDWIAQ